MLASVTTNLDAGKRPTLEQLLEVAPMLCRASRELEPTLAGATLNGQPLTEEMRHELLLRCDAGTLGYVELDVPMLAYEQWDYETFPGSDNRNFVCFRGGEMRALGGTGKRKPFLRDHAQRDSLARGGTLIESKTDSPTDGHHQIHQKARLTEPWAVAMYLRGNMTTVSIGWIPTGPVLCSACNAPVMEKCWHWPGDQLAEVTDDDGSKRKVRKRGGSIVVRWIYTKAELVETSCVPVPGVPTAEMDQLRSTLAARFPGFDTDEHDDRDVPDRKSPPLAAARSVDPQPESNPMPDQNPDQTKQLGALRKALAIALCLPEEHRQHAASLNETDRETFLGASATEREAAVKAALDADPVVFTGEVTGLTVRRSEGARAVQLAKLAEDGAAANKRHETALAAAATLAENNEIAAICSSRIANMPGSDDVHVYLVRSLRAGGGAPELIEASLKALSGASAAVQKAVKAPGVNEELDAGGDGDPLTTWSSAVAAFATKQKIADLGLAEERFLGTSEGRAAKQAYDATRAYGQPPGGR